MKKKICTGCGEEKKLEFFPVNNNKSDKLDIYCRKCANLKSLQYSRSKLGVVSKLFSSQKQRSKLNNWPEPTYTKQQLHSWLFLQPKFESLYNGWVSSGYLRDMSISVDRIDDYKGYSLVNIQLVTFKHNRLKGSKDIKTGKNTKLSKGVSQYTLKGNHLTNYTSIRSAMRCTGIRDTTIGKCCRGLLGHAGGYIWRYYCG